MTYTIPSTTHSKARSQGEIPSDDETLGDNRGGDRTITDEAD